MAFTPDSAGVITVTRNRPEELRRNMDSVYRQDFEGDIRHLVVIDDDPAAVQVVHAAKKRPGLEVVAHLVRRPPEEVDEPPGDRRRVYPRLARLLNEGARICDTTWVSILDDDNAYEPNHLSSLFACAKANDARAVHSGRQLFWSDGEPYLDQRWHTVSDPAEGIRIYNLMCDRGVRLRGTNILLDRAEAATPQAALRPSSVLRDEDPVMLVDQNVWLMRRELLASTPIPEVYSDEDFAANCAPDDKLLEAILAKGVRLFSTGLPTVRYYLGGISNKRSRAQMEVTPAAGRP